MLHEHDVHKDAVSPGFVKQFDSYFMQLTKRTMGVRGGVVVKAIRYKPAGRGLDSRSCHWSFSVTYSFRLGSTQPLTEMSTTCISWA